MADDDKLKIEVELDTTQSKGQLKGEADAIRDVGRVADQTYKGIAKASEDTAKKRDAFGRYVANNEKKSLEELEAAMKKAAESGKGSLEELQKSSEKVQGKFAAMTAAGMAIGGVVSVYKSLISAQNEAVEYGKRQVEQLLALKNNLRDIASMTNSAGGSSDKFVQQFLDIRKSSGLNTEGAKGFIQGYAGSGEAKKGVTISAEEYERAKPMLAKYAAANSSGSGADVEAFGNLAGLEMGFHQNNKAEDVLGNVAAVNDILKNGVGDNPTLIRQYSEQAGSLLNSQGGGYGGSDKALAALISTASIQRSAGKSGTTVEQAARALRGFGEAQGDALAKAGITDQDNMVSSLYKMFDQIKAAEDQGITPGTFLAQSGFKSDEERNSLTALYQGRGYLTKFLDQGQNAKTPQQVQAELNATFRADSGLQANVAQAKLDEAEAHNAELKQHVKPLELEARTRLTARGEGADSAAARQEDEFKGNLRSFWGKALPDGMTAEQYGRRMREEEEMNAIMQERGVAVPNRVSPWNPGYEDWIKSGSYQEAYAEATNTDYLQKQVGGAPKGMGSAPGQVGNDENWQHVVQAIDRQTNQIVPRLDPAPVPVARAVGAGQGQSMR